MSTAGLLQTDYLLISSNASRTNSYFPEFLKELVIKKGIEFKQVGSH